MLTNHRKKSAQALAFRSYQLKVQITLNCMEYQKKSRNKQAHVKGLSRSDVWWSWSQSIGNYTFGKGSELEIFSEFRSLFRQIFCLLKFLNVYKLRNDLEPIEKIWELLLIWNWVIDHEMAQRYRSFSGELCGFMHFYWKPQLYNELQIKWYLNFFQSLVDLYRKYRKKYLKNHQQLLYK